VAFEIWLAVAATSFVILAIPGPTVLLVVSYALGQGWRTALPIALGVALGDLIAMTLSLLGVGALLATSATLFTILKWIGAAYLVWLGIKLWRSRGALDVPATVARSSATTMFGHACLVTALNPKSISFFVAFVPQFVDPHADYTSQVAILVATFVGLGFVNALVYAFVASRARAAVRNPRVLRWFHRGGGTLLIGSGVAAAVTARSPA
jgi:threonine/homoserine/homoserine lactone efflux protein